MEKYIALLRGINVGGKNKVSMPILKNAFIENGFSDVTTYINTGNVLFSSKSKDREELQTACRRIIMEKFGLDIAVMVISAQELSDALSHAPKWWDLDIDSKHNAFFVIPPATPPLLIEAVGDENPEYALVSHYGQIIFWSAPIQTFTRTKWSKAVSSKAYSNITIRNSNTTKKLLELALK